MMGAPPPQPPPPHLGGPGRNWGDWGSEEAKRKYVAMLEAHAGGGPPAGLLGASVVAVFVVLAVALWWLRGWAS